VDDWLESYRQFWNENLDRLEAYAAALQRGGADDRNK